jgi:hypothetical protein
MSRVGHSSGKRYKVQLRLAAPRSRVFKFEFEFCIAEKTQNKLNLTAQNN